MKPETWEDAGNVYIAYKMAEFRREARRAAWRYYGSAVVAGIVLGAFICWRWL